MLVDDDAHLDRYGGEFAECPVGLTEHGSRERVTRPDVLLFDLGGVLVDNDVFSSLRALVGEGLTDQAFRDRWLRSPAVRRFELGEIPPSDFAARFVEEWRLPLAPDVFLESFASWVKQPYPGAAALVSHLRRRHRVCCFSNSNVVHWPRAAGFLALFDGAFSSHLIGRIKPDEAAFEAVLRELAVDAGAVRFFDDTPANVAAARTLGIDAFLVDGFDELLRRLGACDLVRGWRAP